MQCGALCYSVLQCVAVWCNALQCGHTQHATSTTMLPHRTATHCNHPTTPCNTLRHTRTHYNTQQYTKTHLSAHLLEQNAPIYEGTQILTAIALSLARVRTLFCSLSLSLSHFLSLSLSLSLSQSLKETHTLSLSLSLSLCFLDFDE